MGEIHIGCSGWSYSHWRNGVFYPPALPARDRLPYYAERLGTVELNTTFYRLPATSSVAHWVERTPSSFLFAAKASRYLTHTKRLRDLPDHLGRLLERLAPLTGSPKLAALLWQLPPGFRRDDARLADALARLPRGMRHAFEFRDASWFVEGVFALLRSRSVALVVAHRASAPRLYCDEVTAPFAYVRLHEGKGADGKYTRRELEQWRERLSAWSERREIYAYFNNDQQGFAVRNALELQAALA